MPLTPLTLKGLWRAFIFLFLICVACSSEASETPETRTQHPTPVDAAVVSTEGAQGFDLRYPLAGEPRTFNYLAASDSRSKLLAYLTTGTLLEFDAFDQEVREGLCKRFELSGDGLHALLELRGGLKFSDGVPCTVDDIIFTFDAIYAQESSNILKDVLLIDGEKLRLTKLDDLSLEIHFPSPAAAAGFILTTVPILPRHRLQAARDRIEESWHLGTPPEEMVGLGPFVITEHEPGRRTVLGYNPHYWKIDSQGTRLPYLDQIVLEYIDDRSAQLLRFKASELDLLGQLLRPEDLMHLEKEEGIECHDAGPSSNLALFWFNLNRSDNTTFVEARKWKWFSDPRFRKAISSAISRQAIVQNVYLDRATQSFSFIPASNRKWYAADLKTDDGNLAMAETLLAEAGFSWVTEAERRTLIDQEGQRVEFRLVSPSDDVMGKIVSVIQQDLESLGITVLVQQEEFRSVISRIMQSKDYDSALMNLHFPIEPTDISDVLLSSGAMHLWNPVQTEPASAWEAEVDQLTLQLGRTLDEQKRISLFRKIQEILIEHRPFIPLVNRNVLFAWRTGLGNVRPANIFPFALWNSWELYWQKD